LHRHSSDLVSLGDSDEPQTPSDVSHAVQLRVGLATPQGLTQQNSEASKTGIQHPPAKTCQVPGSQSTYLTGINDKGVIVGGFNCQPAAQAGCS